VAVYWLIGGKSDGDGRVAEDRGPTNEAVVFREESWKYGKGYYTAEKPIRYVDTPRGPALVLRYAGALDSAPPRQ
jgi:hypothetical protein